MRVGRFTGAANHRNAPDPAVDGPDGVTGYGPDRAVGRLAERLAVCADGAVEQLPFADGPPLGLGDGHRSGVTIPFACGDTLLVLTDGLVERRDEDIEEGLGRLRGEVHRLAGSPLSTALVELVEAVRDERYDDDVAALALRRTP